MAEITKKTKVIEEEKENITLYPIADLIDNCEALTGHKKHVVVGALFNCEKVEMTKEEFGGKVKAFLKRSVK